MRIKNKSTQASERTALIAGGYSKNALYNLTIPQEPSGVNTSISENAENDAKNSQFSLSDDYGDRSIDSKQNLAYSEK